MTLTYFLILFFLLFPGVFMMFLWNKKLNNNLNKKNKKIINEK